MKTKDLQNIPAVKRKKKGKQMLVPTIIMASMALILVFIGYRKGDGLHITGMQSAWTMTIQVLPVLLHRRFSLILIGENFNNQNKDVNQRRNYVKQKQC